MEFVKCYFFVDGDQDDQDARVRPLCIQCHNQAFRDLGWFYEGACGNWEIKCSKCSGIIKQGKKGLAESSPDTV